jgi:hypothetical protein
MMKIARHEGATTECENNGKKRQIKAEKSNGFALSDFKIGVITGRHQRAGDVTTRSGASKT